MEKPFLINHDLPMYVFLLSMPRFWSLSHFSNCVIFSLFQCETGAVIFPMFLLDVVFNYVLARCGFLVSRFLSSTMSLWSSHSWFLLWGCVSIPILWSMHMLFPTQAESLIASSILSCVFPVVSVLRSRLLFSPRFVVGCGFFFVLGLLWLLLRHFGHDRAKNDSRIGFPHPRCELLVLLRVCSGWSSNCVGLDDLLMAW